MIKSDILFTGYYGQQNTGDDAFVEVASWGAKHYWSKDKIRFLAKEDKLPKTVTSVRGYPITVPRTYYLQQQILLNNTDYLISAGGSTLHSKLPIKSVKKLAIDLKGKGKNIKLGAIGVSIGPFKSIEDEKAVQEYLKNIDFIALRDQRSFEYVKSIDTPYEPVNAFDLAALLPKIYNYEKKALILKSKKIIGVSICPVESILKGVDILKEKKRNKMVVELLKEIDKNTDIHFKFFIINGSHKNGDYKLTKETIEKVRPKSYDVVEYSRDTKKIWKSVAECDFVLSTRLHAAIFACFAEVPFMLNEYHRKCIDFLDDVGYSGQYRLGNSEYDIIDKAKEIINILDNPQQYQLPNRLETMKIMAEKNFTKIIL